VPKNKNKKKRSKKIRKIRQKDVPPMSHKKKDRHNRSKRGQNGLRLVLIETNAAFID